MPPAITSAISAPPDPPSIQPNAMTSAVSAAISMKTLTFPAMFRPPVQSFGANSRSAARINAGMAAAGSRACASATADAASDGP